VLACRLLQAIMSTMTPYREAPTAEEPGPAGPVEKEESPRFVSVRVRGDAIEVSVFRKREDVLETVRDALLHIILILAMLVFVLLAVELPWFAAIPVAAFLVGGAGALFFSMFWVLWRRQDLALNAAGLVVRRAAGPFRWRRRAFLRSDVSTLVVLHGELVLQLGRRTEPLCEGLGHDDDTLRWVAARLRRELAR